MYILSNHFLCIHVKNIGAELTSIKSKTNNIEYLWQGDSSIWGRHAPILFPIVGKLKNHQYIYEGKLYTLPQHGFARDHEFSITEHSDTHIKFSLKNSEKTLQLYPFKFELQVNYSLQENTLHTTYTVINKNPTEMYFSMGAHPGFRWPLLKGSSEDSYYLEFNYSETAYTQLLENGLRNGYRQLVLSNSTKLPLSKKLFQNDALIFDSLISDKICFRSIEHTHGIRITYTGFPYLGIWSKPGPFLCIEPWYGIADKISHDGNLKTKEGILKLKGYDAFHCHYTLEFF
jgi:Galactose mutarotase and related enzymes